MELEEEVDLGTYTPACLPEQGEDYSVETENLFTYGKEIILALGLIPNSKADLSDKIKTYIYLVLKVKRCLLGLDIEKIYNI